MAYQMTITLSDDEYAALSAESARTGKPVEEIVHETLVPHLSQPQQKQPMSEEEFTQYLYRKGIIMNIPTNEPLSPEEVTEREQIAQRLAAGKPLSEIVIEDRGPKE
jgi:hypothetical protein